MLRTVGALILAYLIGSLDFAVIVARLRGEDIYSMGSGNPGASNALRSMGKAAGALVLLGDLAKGVAAAGFRAINYGRLIYDIAICACNPEIAGGYT